MTLVVYKNKMLAADTRASLSATLFDNNDKCSSCGKDAHVVDDTAKKIMLPPSDKEIKFRGSRVLAVGQAGNQALSIRLRDALMAGEDIEEIYRHYQIIHGPSAENKVTSSFLICCDDVNYGVRIPSKGKLEVSKFTLDKIAAIGSDLKVVEWLDVLVPTSTASTLINLVMAKNKSVGGPVHEVNLADTAPEVKVVETKEPQALLARFVEMFDMGLKAYVAKETPTPDPKPVRRSHKRKATT